MVQQVGAGFKTHKLLFVDAGIYEAEILLMNLQPGFTVIPISAESNPVLQVSEVISAYAPVSEMVILAHAEPGQIVFANQSFDLNTLNEYEHELINWRQGLTEDAKICIYGCRLAYGDVGQTFIQTLAFLTGAKVASSTLPIGNLGIRQNWELDSFTQSFEVLIPFHPNSRMEYPHRLEPEISILGGSIIEGSSGFRQLEFEVTLSEPATNTVEIRYRTLDGKGTATGSVDYTEEF
ncbi:MAG TPA: hypothetical protein DEO56_10095, partial [Nitrosomonas nitrosa]|nr:hypothetical protein [Nitrosomonas nitrosa]